MPKVVFFGTPEFAVPSLQQLLAHPNLVVSAVVTQPDKRRGRGSQLIPSPVKQLAEQQKIPVWQPARIKKHPETLDYLSNCGADFFVVVAYGQILSQSILDMPRAGCINLHGSLLPKYRGAAPIQWCIYHGETVTGNTTMLMDAGMDTGAMLLKQELTIAPDETAPQLASRLATAGADLLVTTLEQFSTITPIPQDPSLATYAPLITKADYELNWSRAAIALHNQIRAFFPNCVTSLRGQAVKIISTKVPEPTASAAEPGQIIQILKNQGILIQTSGGQLLVTHMQLPGKPIQSAVDIANGLRLQPGETFSNS